MKLKNKRTGEIGNFCYGYTNELCVSWQKDDGFWAKQEYTSLAELNAEWEDAPEEPKGYWFIDCAAPYPVDFCEFNEDTENDKEIGNYFETKEEAEKAVEKLKAWKRLKDGGFRFCGHDDRDRGQLGDIVIYAEMPTFEYDDDSTRDDLDLLFSGEDD